jgi:hypothetical protein
VSVGSTGGHAGVVVVAVVAGPHVGVLGVGGELDAAVVIDQVAAQPPAGGQHPQVAGGVGGGAGELVGLAGLVQRVGMVQVQPADKVTNPGKVAGGCRDR